MRTIFAGALCLGLLCLGGAVAAQEKTFVGVGDCAVTINDRVVSKGRLCSEIRLKEDLANGRLTLDFDFPDGFKLQIAGPAVAFGPNAYSLTPDQIIYANPGQTNPQTLANAPGAAQIKGRCDVRKDETGAEFQRVKCRVGSPIGRIDVGFTRKTPKGK